MSGITGRGRLGRKFLQKGLREQLLCEDCEQFLNDKYEKPFKRYWFDNNPLPKSLPSNGVQLRGIDYRTFKLFHLSILFRCSVSSVPTFSDVDLGPHESKLRQMIQAESPGQVHEYPVFAFALIDSSGAPNRQILAPPFRARFEGHTVYQTIFGGCMWTYGVTRHVSPMLRKVALQPNGFLWIIPERWESTAYMQDVSKLLRRVAL
jgi:hypothetical protein